MRKFLIFLFSIIAITSFSFAQTTAMDWTKDDCNGINHNLFTELDSGYVILCEYVMNCATCISAANYLNEIYLDYEASDPGKVKFYAIDWKTSFTCSSFESWASGLSCTLFLDGYDEVNYYGGMGMPTVVVLGGSDHKVYYSKLGYSNTLDNSKIKSAIDEALNATGITENISPINSLSIYPNPAIASATLTYSLQAASHISFIVFNMLGEKIEAINIGQQPAGEHQYLLNTQMLNDGLYFIQIIGGIDKKMTKLTVVN